MLCYLYYILRFFILFWQQAFTRGPENYIFIKFELFEFLRLSIDRVLLKLHIRSSATPRLKLIIRGSAAPRRLTQSLKLHKTLLISDLWLEQSLKWEKRYLYGWKVMVLEHSKSQAYFPFLERTFLFLGLRYGLSKPRYARFLTTDLHYDLGKWKFVSRNVKFAFEFFCSWTITFQPYRTIIPSLKD